MRIAIGQVMQESYTFNPLPTTRGDFEAFGIPRGTELIEKLARTNEIGGIIQTLRSWLKAPQIIGLVRFLNGFELARFNLVSFKSFHETSDEFALAELIGHFVNYRCCPNSKLVSAYNEDPEMHEKLKQFYDETVEEFLRDMPIEKRLEGLPPEERLKGLPPEELRKHLSPEERLKGLPPGERLKGLPPEERLKGLPPEELRKHLPAEERLKGLSAEEVLEGLDPETLKALARKLRSNGSS